MIATPWKFAIAGFAALAVLAGAYLQGRSDGKAHCQAKHEAHAKAAALAAMEETAKAALETARRYRKHGEIVDAKNKEIEQAHADADAARNAGDRLRVEISRHRAACRSGNPALAGSSAAAGTTGDLLAYVQLRLDEAADGIARHADEARAAGRACERAYDALTP